MAAKKWYLREKNSSRYINSEWIYHLVNHDWVDDVTKAKSWKTKKEAMSYCELLGRGEVHGE